MGSNNMKFSLLMLGLCLTLPLMAADRLPVLIGKQASNNLRLISNDGKYTYYQRSSGSLLLSTNYKVAEVLKGNAGSQFEMISSPARKKIIVSANDNFHRYFSLRQELTLYTLNFGDTNPTLLGKGLSPKLHRQDSWASFYSPSKQALIFTNLQSSLLKFTVTLANKISPYFTPEAVMVDEDRILYTDLNSEGIPGVIDFRRGTGRLSPFLKVASPLQKLELCVNDQSLFIGQFGLARSGLGSSITRYPLKNLIPQEGKTIYQSERDDIGHMVCDFSQEKIYFVQNKTQKGDKEFFEVIALSLADNEQQTLTSMQFPSQIINMDGTLLLPMNGKIFILEGNNELVRDSLPKKAITPTAEGKDEEVKE